MNKIFTFICLTGTMALASCGHGKQDYDASGTFEATEIIVSAEATGRIIQFDAVEGERLDSGQFLGYIDSTQLSLKRQQLMASLKAMQARRPEVPKQVAALQQQVASARIERNRIQNLVKAKAATQKALDDVETQLSVLEKQLAAQMSSLTQTDQGIGGEMEAMQLQIAQLEDQLRKCRISSPVRATLLAKYAEAGELAVPGKALFKLADLEQVFLRAYVTSAQLTQLQLEQEVDVFADFGEESRAYKGQVSWISGKSEFTPKTIQTRDERANLTYAIKVAVKNDGFLKIGMYGQLRLPAVEPNNQ